jgi:hypothetical protein
LNTHKIMDDMRYYDAMKEYEKFTLQCKQSNINPDEYLPTLFQDTKKSILKFNKKGRFLSIFNVKTAKEFFEKCEPYIKREGEKMIKRYLKYQYL